MALNIRPLYERVNILRALLTKVKLQPLRRDFSA